MMERYLTSLKLLDYLNEILPEYEFHEDNSSGWNRIISKRAKNFSFYTYLKDKDVQKFESVWYCRFITPDRKISMEDSRDFFLYFKTLIIKVEDFFRMHNELLQEMNEINSIENIRNRKILNIVE